MTLNIARKNRMRITLNFEGLILAIYILEIHKNDSNLFKTISKSFQKDFQQKFPKFSINKVILKDSLRKMKNRKSRR